ncbi:MAG: nucleotidyltransferase family protein [Candidatus Aenigmarchaeota archaeon]|nr:nucleotidyltransferase family protein [Candidatus Aenigmarchaeota archaeon]
MKNDMAMIKKTVVPILRQHDVKKAALFGSYARGTVKKTSDIDILIDIRKDISLLDFVGIKLELEKALKRRVDLVEYDTVKPLIREKILKEQVKIL